MLLISGPENTNLAAKILIFELLGTNFRKRGLAALSQVCRDKCFHTAHTHNVTFAMLNWCFLMQL